MRLPLCVAFAAVAVTVLAGAVAVWLGWVQ